MKHLDDAEGEAAWWCWRKMVPLRWQFHCCRTGQRQIGNESSKSHLFLRCSFRRPCGWTKVVVVFVVVNRVVAAACVGNMMIAVGVVVRRSSLVVVVLDTAQPAVDKFVVVVAELGIVFAVVAVEHRIAVLVFAAVG